MSGIDSLKVLIIIPTYNERENIEKITAAVLDTIAHANILIVDDNSPDGTGDIADSLASEDDRIFALHRTAKEGLGKAYIDGFRWGMEREYDRLVEMDADFSHPPRYLRPLLEASLEADVAIGSRYVRGGGTQNWSLVRKILSRGGGIYSRLILGIPIQDLTAGFVCWRREVLEAIPLDELHASGYGFQIELKYRAFKMGYQLVETPILFPDRSEGSSKMDRKIALEAIAMVWRLRFAKI